MPYGIFIELTPNLAGLAELRDDRPGMDVQIGSTATVFIKSIIPERMKIKLVLIDSYSDPVKPEAPRYFLPEGQTHVDRWVYSPKGCEKRVETVFSTPALQGAAGY